MQAAIGGYVMTGGAAAPGMDLPRADEGRDRTAVATGTYAVGGHRRPGGIGGHRGAMVMGMAAKIAGMTIGAGRGGLAVSKWWAGRIKTDAGDVQEVS